MNDKQKAAMILDESNQLKSKTGCEICGSKMVYIRGRYPTDKKRKICPTCAYERIEQINQISSHNYGKCYQT